MEILDPMLLKNLLSAKNRRNSFLRFFFGLTTPVNFIFFVLITSISCVYNTLPEPVNCEANPVIVELVSVVDTDCDLSEGSIEVVASGGSGIYNFRLNDDENQPGSFFLNLAAGVYQVVATDASGCDAVIEVTVRNRNGLNLAFETGPSGCKSGGGDIRVIPSDGVPPYNFRINNNGFQTGDTFSGLAQGQYNIVVNDATGCEVSQIIMVPSGVRFSTDVSPIIETNCAITGCHNGTQFPDLRVFNNIRENAARIKQLTLDRTMPEDGTLTQDQINKISCWVDDGTPDN
jgi:hypothetical protein